ncbi:hypothetical protein [Desulfosarcina ovata]|uniref:Uncharacterized protein n=1 Tax=Desulfosarcina ovata subsp. ovata TaxID=2752305 RepID=A0A5K8AHB2_9BACT|nr:hypothetical protein [Desulfosarcina ovata]BBO92072.1 hypothetical protein DSCOOX_52520 [Desulfosarcina ovata subsp. ovata]
MQITTENEIRTCDICSADEIHMEILREDGYYIERDHALVCLSKCHSDGRTDIFARSDHGWFHHLKLQGDQPVKEVATDFAATGLVMMNKDIETVQTIDPGVACEKEFSLLHDHLFGFIRFDEGVLEWKGREVPYQDIELTQEGQDFMGEEIIRRTGDIDDAVNKLIIDVMWNYFHM